MPASELTPEKVEAMLVDDLSPLVRDMTARGIEPEAQVAELKREAIRKMKHADMHEVALIVAHIVDAVARKLVGLA